jgi:hypothetical protein
MKRDIPHHYRNDPMSKTSHRDSLRTAVLCALLLCGPSLVRAQTAGRAGAGAARLVDVTLGSASACATIEGSERCAELFGATDRIEASAADTTTLAIVVHGAGGDTTVGAPYAIEADSMTTVLVMGERPRYAARVITLRAPLRAPLADTVSMVRIVHAVPDADVGRLDVVFRMVDAARIPLLRFAYGSVTDYVPVVPGAFNVYGYYSDRASTEMVLDEGGEMPRGAYVTAVITGRKSDGTLGVHLLIDSDSAGGPLERLDDRSTLGVPPKEAAHVLAVAPNPSDGAFVLEVPIALGDHVTAAVVDALGRLVRRIAWDAITSERTMRIDLAGAPAGSYRVRIAGERGDVSTVVIVRR